jgi:hypothetical protein
VTYANNMGFSGFGLWGLLGTGRLQTVSSERSGGQVPVHLPG